MHILNKNMHLQVRKVVLQVGGIIPPVFVFKRNIFEVTTWHKWLTNV